MPIVARINGQEPPQVDLADIDLGSYDFWGRDEEFRHGAFVTLRREAPIAYFQAAPGGIAGSWSLGAHDA